MYILCFPHSNLGCYWFHPVWWIQKKCAILHECEKKKRFLSSFSFFLKLMNIVSMKLKSIKNFLLPSYISVILLWTLYMTNLYSGFFFLPYHTACTFFSSLFSVLFFYILKYFRSCVLFLVY
jgi:hypothetical protein